nr:MAG TPA: hypothetical protein [Caudoviricetes sp.]
MRFLDTGSTPVISITKKSAHLRRKRCGCALSLCFMIGNICFVRWKNCQKRELIQHGCNTDATRT